MNWFKKWFHNCMCEALVSKHAKLEDDNIILIDRNNKLHSHVQTIEAMFTVMHKQIDRFNTSVTNRISILELESKNKTGKKLIKPIIRKPKNVKKA